MRAVREIDRAPLQPRPLRGRRRARRHARDGGVALVYELVPLHPIEQIRVRRPLDAPGIDEGRLRRAGRRPLRRVAAGRRARRDVAALVEDAAAGARLPARRRSPRASAARARARSRDAACSRSIPAPRARIGAVEITGDAGHARSRASSTGSACRHGRAVRAATRSTRAHRAVPRRPPRTPGYYEARLTVERRLPSTTASRCNLTLDGRARARTSASCSPAIRCPPTARDELVPIAREGSADEDLLEDSSNRIEEYLRAQGYRDAAGPAHARASQRRDCSSRSRSSAGRSTASRAVGHHRQQRDVPLAELAAGLRVREPASRSRRRRSTPMSPRSRTCYRRRGFAAVDARRRSMRAGRRPAGRRPSAGRVRDRRSPRTSARSSDSVRDRGQRVGSRGRRCWPALGLQPGPAVLRRRRLAVDRDAIQLQYANLGLPERAVVDGTPGLSADGTRADVVFTVQRRAAGLRRSRADRRQRAHADRDDRARAAAQARRSARPGGGQREPAPAGGARAVPPRAHHRSSAHGDETTRDLLVTVEEAPVTTHRLRRRPRGRPRIVRRSEGERRVRAARVRAARLLRDRPPQSVRQEPIDQPVHAHQPAAAKDSAELAERRARSPAAARSASASTACSARTASRACSARRPTRS